MADSAVIQSVRQYLHALVEQGIAVRYGVLFGSHARNQTQTWSDIDLAVVSEQFDAPLRHDDIMLLWRVAARMDSRIEPVAVGQKQFELGSDRAIVEIARREGQIINL
ncbi:MAG: nucleotidyltransferase domain-containing protein [Anaerolineae bacterium]